MVLVERDATEHGARYFGQDYGRLIGGWVARHYRPVRQFGQTPFTGKGFGITVYQRADAA